MTAKFSKKMISLISSCLLGVSFSGVKGMDSGSEDNVSVHEDLDYLRGGHVFRSGGQPKLTFKLATTDRNTYLENRERIRMANGYNILAEAPYNITNLAVNYPKTFFFTPLGLALLTAGGLYYLNSNTDAQNYDDEDDLDDNYDQIK